MTRPVGLQDLSSKLTGQLIDLTGMVRRDLSSEARKKVNTLIITDVHAREIIETFVRDSVMDTKEFAWESQLRFYWDRTADDLLVRQCTGQRFLFMLRGWWVSAFDPDKQHIIAEFSSACCCMLWLSCCSLSS